MRHMRSAPGGLPPPAALCTTATTHFLVPAGPALLRTAGAHSAAVTAFSVSQGQPGDGSQAVPDGSGTAAVTAISTR